MSDSVKDRQNPAPSNSEPENLYNSPRRDQSSPSLSLRWYTPVIGLVMLAVWHAPGFLLSIVVYFSGSEPATVWLARFSDVYLENGFIRYVLVIFLVFAFSIWSYQSYYQLIQYADSQKDNKAYPIVIAYFIPLINWIMPIVYHQRLFQGYKAFSKGQPVTVDSSSSPGIILLVVLWWLGWQANRIPGALIDSISIDLRTMYPSEFYFLMRLIYFASIAAGIWLVATVNHMHAQGLARRS